MTQPLKLCLQNGFNLGKTPRSNVFVVVVVVDFVFFCVFFSFLLPRSNVLLLLFFCLFFFLMPRSNVKGKIR